MSESLIAPSYAEIARLHRHFRLLNGSPEALEYLLNTPGLTGEQLETWLQTPTNLVAFQQLVSSPSGVSAVAISSTAMAAILASGNGRSNWVDSPLSSSFWLPAYSPLPAARGSHTATLLPDGRVLVTGGHETTGNSNVRATAWIFDPTSPALGWQTATSLPAVRRAHAATLLPNGRVLVAGGFDGSAARSECWIGSINGTTITWASATSLPAVRFHPTATLLPDGRVLVAGGHDLSAARSECWIGSISGTTITWQTATSLPAARWLHTATMLSTGVLLLTGGSVTGDWAVGTNHIVVGAHSANSAKIIWR